MKIHNAEIMKGTKTEMNLEDVVKSAELTVQAIEMEAGQAEEDARSLELELIEAQAAHEKKEEAERSGHETNEKITELGG